MTIGHDSHESSSADGIPYGRRVSDLAAAHPDRVAFVFVPLRGSEQPVSWRELDLRSNRVAGALDDRGIGVGDIVVLGLPNCVTHVVMAIGAWKAGATVLPVRYDLPEWERDRVLAVAGAALVITDEWQTGPAVVAPDVLEARSPDDGPVADRRPDPARAIATSGSTGTPKVIRLLGSGVWQGVVGDNLAAKASRQHADQVQLIPAPLYHTNGALITFTALMRDQFVVLMERFDAALALGLIERHRVQVAVATTIMLQRMARSSAFEETDLSSLELLLHGGAPLPQWLARVWIDRIGPDRFAVSFGSSENIGMCYATGTQWLEHPGTVGRPNNTELEIRDDGGERVPVGEVGRICMRRTDRDDLPFRYLGDAVAATGPDGFTFVGDLGRVDVDGYLYIADRRVDMIISGGANVYPAEVEAALTEHPGVGDVVVVGVPDEEWGARVHAVVEPADPRDPPTFDELRRHCRSRLAAYKVPKGMNLVAALPRSAAGKIRRSEAAALVVDDSAGCTATPAVGVGGVLKDEERG